MSYLQSRGYIRRVLVTTIVAALVAGCAGSDEPAASPDTGTVATASALLTPSDFETYVDDNPDVPVINVHIPYEQHIEGTDEFIPFESILESPELPTDRDAPIALYCRSGAMSAEATADLLDAGYTNVVDLDGGMNAWSENGRSLVDDPTAVDG